MSIEKFELLQIDRTPYSSLSSTTTLLNRLS